MMKRTLIIAGIIAVVAIIILIVIGKVTSKKDISNLYSESQKGQFDIIVTTTGELQAKKSTDIYGPDFTQSRGIRVMDIKITDMVPEGTEVRQGDYVATLDRTAFDNSLKDELERLTTFETNLEMKILDTAVTLSNLRDNIKNLRFTVEEAAITLQQSKYEPPTTIRQAEISLDKANRSLDQTIRGYSLQVEKAKSDMRTNKNNVNEQRQRVSDLQTVLSKFLIKAPSDGMIIYKRDRMGAKRKVGSSISPWDNVVATLPDMSSMISKTYVNEIDVSKVKPGQKVEIVVDAFPEKSYTGIVSSVANIGEQLPNADAKVFEVLIEVNESDPILRPSMTTGNKIITKTINDVVYIPLESVQAGADSIPFVYLKNGNRQVVVLGESNENNVAIEQGLEPGVQIYLSTPEKPEGFKLVGEELISVIRERAKAKKAEELRIRQEAEKAKEQRGDMMDRGGMPVMTPEMMQRFQNMRGAGQGGTRDTAAMRRFMNTRNQQGGTRDTSARRRTNAQQGQQAPGQNAAAPAKPAIKK
ncbi:MAG: efflux RND transporter periplasmic adaptor subunit [Bacteroidia bacterium]|nr:efflux RND transporter periplasmic adaptor subunit [Bacteroidia bacterium]